MISDEMLSQAAARAATLINKSLPEASACNHPFSARFERKMGRIIHMTNHPVLYRTLRSVAMPVRNSNVEIAVNPEPIIKDSRSPILSPNSPVGISNKNVANDPQAKSVVI